MKKINKIISNVFDIEIRKISNKDKTNKNEKYKKPTMKDIFHYNRRKKVGKCGKTKKEGCKCKM